MNKLLLKGSCKVGYAAGGCERAGHTLGWWSLEALEGTQLIGLDECWRTAERGCSGTEPGV